MEYQDLVRDFARRTRHNLDVIRQLQSEERATVYEVTQLINSMLGLLILPHERYYESIPATSLAELRDQGWPTPLLDGDFDEPTDLRDLIRLLRNSVAHFNIVFTETQGIIDGIQLANKRRGRITWRATLNLDDLGELTERFIVLILGAQP